MCDVRCEVRGARKSTEQRAQGSGKKIKDKRQKAQGKKNFLKK
jgi:hypothetical protein